MMSRVSSSSAAVMAALTCGQRQVRGGQCDSQRAAGQQHHRTLHAAALRQVFRVAGERDAGVVDDALLHRRGDHGVELGPRGIRRVARSSSVEHPAGIACVEPAGVHRRGKGHVLDPEMLAGRASGSAQLRCARAASRRCISQADDLEVGAGRRQRWRRKHARRGPDRCRPVRRRSAPGAARRALTGAQTSVSTKASSRRRRSHSSVSSSALLSRSCWKARWRSDVLGGVELRGDPAAARCASRTGSGRAR